MTNATSLMAYKNQKGMSPAITRKTLTLFESFSFVCC